MPVSTAQLTCPLCGQTHAPISLAPGERALCRRCNTIMAQGPRLGRDASLVFAITGLILMLPTFFLPFITVGKFGQERVGLIFSGVEGLWENGMRLLAIWVLLCGAVVPILLLAILVGVLLPARLHWPQRKRELLAWAADAMSYWAIPEVQLRAVLVALMKLGSLVDVTIGAGFWCYAGMSFFLLVAWRSFSLRPRSMSDAPAEHA